jgi:hypothetical protein
MTRDRPLPRAKRLPHLIAILLIGVSVIASYLGERILMAQISDRTKRCSWRPSDCFRHLLPV